MSSLSSNILPTKLQSIIHHTLDRHGNPSESQTPTDGHRNERASTFHAQQGLHSKDLDEFLSNQVDTTDEGRTKLENQFPEQKEFGWDGYVDWDSSKEMRDQAHDVLESKTFSPIPEFQLVPLPSTNPILLGNRWKEYHVSLGPTLENLPGKSWDIVHEEKDVEGMLHVLDFPYNGEPRRNLLMRDEITSNRIFYVRNHGGVPTIAPEALHPHPNDPTLPTWKLEITGMFKDGKQGGLVQKRVFLTMSELKDPNLFKQVEVPITLQCSGTRRIEQIDLYPGFGDEELSAPWAEGAIGTARWKGVTLKSVLKHLGGVYDEDNSLHCEFVGADTYFKKNEVSSYKVSVPYRKAKADGGKEVILAWEMNGAPLPKLHGHPLRAVVAGVIGARSCKWLTKINLMNEPSLGPVQRKEYLYFNSQIGKHNDKYSAGFSIQDMPVSSAILAPLDKSVHAHSGTIHCEGWAYSGGGRWIERVEVSPDGGFTWFQVPDGNLSTKHYHTMRLWHMELPIHAEGWLELAVRAWDNAINTQPTYVRSAWQFTLHVTSSAHRIKVYSADKRNPATAERLALFEKHGDSLEPITRPAIVTTETDEAYFEAMSKKGPREPRN